LDENKESYAILAICLLVSAGTFLYVATVHVIASTFTGAHTHALVPGEVKEHNPVYEGIKGITLIILGATIPFLLSVFLN